MNAHLDIFFGQRQLIEAAVAVAVTVAALVVWLAVNRFLLRSARHTKTTWDDSILRAVSAPVTTLIVVLGTLQVCKIFFAEWTGGASGSTEGDLVGTFDTLQRMAVAVMIFWMLIRMVSVLEVRYRRQQTIRIGDKSIDAGTIYSIFRMLRAIIFAVAVLTLMNSFGVSISGILAFGGIGGIVFGFAAKDALSNFFAGLMIFWERPFAVGDWIRCESANIEGVVEHIGWRMTQVRTFDQRPLYMPNSLFFNSVIENPQRMTNRRIYQYFGLCYADIERLPKVLADVRAMLGEHEGIAHDKIMMVNFERYGASSLDFFIYAMTKTTAWGEYNDVREDILFKVADIVRANGCDFAFPTRTVAFQTPPPGAPAPFAAAADLAAADASAARAAGE